MSRISSRFHCGRKRSCGDRWQEASSAESDRRAFGKLSSSSISSWDRTEGFVWRDGAAEVGIDALGARGDIQRHRGASIDTIHG